VTDTTETERPEPAPPVETPIDRRGEWTRLGLLLGLFALLGLKAGWAVFVVVAGIAVMIFFHELGHYLTAKWSGMKVTEFFLGIGPRIWSFRRGETEYGIKLIPVVAYVKIVGMSTMEEVEPADESRTYRQQSYPRRMLVASAGSLMHFIMAFALLVVALMQGVPGGTLFGLDEAEYERKAMQSPDWVVHQVTPDSPADEAGLERGDRVVEIDGNPITNWQDVRDVVGSRGGERVNVVIERDGQRIESLTRLDFRDDDPDLGFLGVGPDIDLVVESRSLIPAVGAAGKEMVTGVRESVGALARFFSPSGLGTYADNVREGEDRAPAPSGGEPVSDDGEDNRLLSLYGAVRLGAEITEGGLVGFLLFFASINLFVGLFNLIPLLPFDGGHMAVATYERIRSRGGRRYYVDMTKLIPITYAVVFGMILLGITSLYLDIVNPVNI
jgi:membrane-associated protease RseP (regulator of RpoE activity)